MLSIMKKSSNDGAVETQQGPVRKRTVQNSDWKLTLLIQRMSNNNETLLSFPNDHASMEIWTPPQEHGALPLAGTRLPPPPTHFRLTQFLRSDGFREISSRNLQDNWLHTHSCADEPIAIVRHLRNSLSTGTPRGQTALQADARRTRYSAGNFKDRTSIGLARLYL